MTPLEKYDASLQVLNSVSKSIVDRYGAAPSSAAELDALRAERDAAVKARDDAFDQAEQWRNAYDEFVARASADAARLSSELAPLAAERPQPDASAATQ